MEATVLDNVTSQMRGCFEEPFGPVRPTVRINGEEDAIRVANDTECGLSAAMFCPDVQQAQTPFGGKAAIAEFTDHRWATVEHPSPHCPL